jgi:hypothetical protein
MAYTTLNQVYSILAQALTSATNKVVNGQPVPLWRFGKDKDSNVIPDDVVYQYISWAGEQIDSAISELYATPLTERADVELSLISDIDAYNEMIQVNNINILNIGDTLIFITDLTEERHTVAAINLSTNSVDLQEPLIGIYTVENTRIIRVKYPSNISLICARLAAANIYDKFFASQASPNVSDYGSTLRKWALSDLNSIINGIIILHGQKRIGHRFFNPNLRDRYGLPPLNGENIKMDGGDK